MEACSGSSSTFFPHWPLFDWINQFLAVNRDFSSIGRFLNFSESDISAQL